MLYMLNMYSQSRLAVNSVTAGNYDLPMRISRFVSELNGKYDFDSAVYEYWKLEQVSFQVVFVY